MNKILSVSKYFRLKFKPNNLNMEFNFIQVLGRVHGKYAGFQGIMEKIDSLENEVSNLGPDMIYNIFPFLRFFPFKHSKKLNELLKTKQEMISLVEQLTVYTISYILLYQYLLLPSFFFLEIKTKEYTILCLMVTHLFDKNWLPFFCAFPLF